ncbi:membrane protein [Microvirga vignae]|uniref:Membrane protein n=1 Tax=Microvirga vignae TaxID=1225564 RepID=A0A0H1R7Q6_9HYPH|nr:DUF4405 domain-containing protein [Microvirga vignae]KLK91280.1 membrane protein [Microvirga vignae]
MKTIVVKRLALPAAMAALLLLALAYWWLENLPHEIFGTALFALLAWHIAVNRIWFMNLFRGDYDRRRVITLVLHLLLIANMAVLLVTSIVISKSVFGLLPIPDSIYLRDVHWFAAYWVMIIVGVHLGLHWTRVMAMMRTTLRLSPDNPPRTFVLRIAAAILAGFGAWSFSVLGVWAKLTFTYSLDFWDFDASVTPFFGHWAGVVGLPAIITHYGMMVLRNHRRTAPAGRQQSRLSAGASKEAARA